MSWTGRKEGKEEREGSIAEGGSEGRRGEGEGGKGEWKGGK